jgi:hypothetical protein
VQDLDPGKSYTILLAPKIYELNEVVVEAKGRAYKAKFRRNMSDFKKMFLGTTLNAQNCEILNESSLYFSSHDGVFMAYAFRPLEIENNNLGYRIRYFLDRFEYNPETHSLIIRGNILFEDLTGTYDEGKAFRIEKRRKTAYLGSRMHLIRSLWDNMLDSSGYELRNELNEKLLYNNIILEEKGTSSGIQRKFIDYNGVIRICYFTKNPTSSLTCIIQPVYIEKSGYFEPLDLSWSGEISVQRIAALLPLDYVVPKKK